MRIPSNKVSSVVNFFKSELKDLYESDEVKNFISIAFENILDYTKTDLTLNMENTMSESELLKFNNVVKDLKKHNPIQYIFGRTNFYGLDFIVNENVLIPRPETEELVDLIVKDYSTLNIQHSAFNILDIGTGSGCIAIALKKNIPNANVYALDISEKALKISEKNAKQNNVQINFVQADILVSPIRPFTDSPIQFDIIVSNPPYVTHSDKKDMKKNVLDYEPPVALFVDDTDQLIYYKAISDFALKNLMTKGKLYFEINEKYGNELVNLIKEKGFKNVRIQKDINNKNRILQCTR